MVDSAGATWLSFVVDSPEAQVGLAVVLGTFMVIFAKYFLRHVSVELRKRESIVGTASKNAFEWETIKASIESVVWELNENELDTISPSEVCALVLVLLYY